ncbi:MAG TPA: pyridoxal phosphate-dependent aminotransferase [Vicinamibacteria bacterium]|nr:pyridoxal phosphate-dependent aminotransferase [Vicinamibacteria bacterium]
MFSARTRWDRTVNRLAALAQRKRAAGRHVFDLTETNPTRVGLLAPPDALAGLAGEGALRYEPDPRGLEAARRAVSADYALRGVAVPADRIALTASTSEAYAFVFKLLCDPGDAVLVPRPSYPLFEYLAGLESVEVEPYPLHYDGEWRIDLPALREGVGARTRAVVLVSPNNPTGSFAKADEAAAVQEIAAEAGLAVVSDEVFADYAWTPGRAGPSLARDGPALAFALGGLSKSCGLPQLKLGWTAVSGPAALREEALARLELLTDTYLSVGTPVQHAAPALLARAAELRAPIAARVEANLDALRRLLPRGAPATLLAGEGGWSAVLRIPATVGEEERVLALLDTHDVLVHPGYFFDFPREAYLVPSLLPRPADFEEAVSRILRVL